MMQKKLYGALMGLWLSSFAYSTGLSLTQHTFTDKEKSQIREWFLDTWEQNKDRPHSEEWTLRVLQELYEKEKASLHPLLMSINMNQNQKLVLDTLTGRDLKSSALPDPEKKARLHSRALFLMFLIRQPELKVSSTKKNVQLKTSKKNSLKVTPTSLRSISISNNLRKYLKQNLFRRGSFETHKNLMYAFNRFFQAYEMEINHISQVVHSHSYSYHKVEDRIQTIRKHLLKKSESRSRWTLFASSLSAGLSGPAWFKSCQEVFLP